MFTNFKTLNETHILSNVKIKILFTRQIVSEGLHVVRIPDELELPKPSKH